MNIIYIRTSSKEQNPENQLKDCISINNYGPYEIFEDKQSAWNDNKEREGFDRLRLLIKTKKIEHLIVWDFDRLYRNRIKFKEFLAFLKAYKVQLHSFRQDWFEDLHKIPEPWNDIVYELMVNIYGHIAEEESTKKSQRVKAAVRKTGNKTVSYKGNKWGRKTLSTQKLNELRTIYTPNKTIRELAKELNISKSVVHKYMKIIKRENLENKGVH
jgi:DNA invertase Pin-like site-specific DNA recombinase